MLRPNEGREESLRRKSDSQLKIMDVVDAEKTESNFLSFDLRPSLPLFRTLAALLLLARKDSVGVMRRSTILLSHGLSARPRAAGRQRDK